MKIDLSTPQTSSQKSSKGGQKKVESTASKASSELPKKTAQKDAKVEISKEAMEASKSSQEQIKEQTQTTQIKEKAPVGESRKSKTINKPAIIFVKDMTLNPFSSGSLGLDSMASNIPHAEVYSWSEGDAIYESIQRRPHTQPVILVGHGLGGDTAVEVANRLNKVESSFRKVNLLVTLNSQGFDNDVIPQNVSANLNFITEKGWFNDGPNIARNTNITKVMNQIRPEEHDELDESSEVQFAVFEEINKTLNDAVASKMRNWSHVKDRIDKYRSQ